MADVARGKVLVAKLRGQAGVRDPEALAAYLGRFKKARKAGKSVAEAKKVAAGGGRGGGGKPPTQNGSSGGEVPNPEERFAADKLPADVTDAQGSYLRSLIQKGTPDTYPQSTDGDPQLIGNSELGEYAILVNMPTPKNKQEASAMIDGLKSGGPKGYARKNQEWFAGVAAKLTKKFGNDLSGIRKAAQAAYGKMSVDEKIEMQDDRKAYKRRIINPLLKV